MNDLSMVLEILKAAQKEAALLASYANRRERFHQAVDHAYRRDVLEYVIDLLTDEEYLNKQAE